MDWLLSGEPWIEYRARLDLLGQAEDDAGVRAARRAMLADARVRALVAGLAGWPGEVLASHKSASQPFHRLAFLADLGLRKGDPGIDAVAAAVMAHPSEEGPFALTMNVSAGHGGTGVDTWSWALCDAPVLLYALVRFGYGDEPSVRAAIAHVAGLVCDNGWPCATSAALKFRGPGRKDDPCPYATLVMLKLLSELEDCRDGPACRAGAEALLGLWERSLDRHPYIFYMGNDFRKLKLPFVWYDIVHVLEVLTRFPWLRKDARLLDMAAVLRAKADQDDSFTPESVWTWWKDWEFGQKKVPSRWLTLAARRILGRLEG